MSGTDILHEIEALPAEERLRLVEKLVQLSEADVPESLRESMAQAERGELIELDDALKGSLIITSPRARKSRATTCHAASHA